MIYEMESLSVTYKQVYILSVFDVVSARYCCHTHTSCGCIAITMSHCHVNISKQRIVAHRLHRMMTPYHHVYLWYELCAVTIIIIVLCASIRNTSMYICQGIRVLLIIMPIIIARKINIMHQYRSIHQYYVLTCLYIPATLQ